MCKSADPIGPALSIRTIAIHPQSLRDSPVNK